ncbi:MAG TPA: ABC transporter permease [Nocardioidaceae bacterium]|nr:ABC transporter permease [Nocardioidaceae bacterium]
MTAPAPQASTPTAEVRASEIDRRRRSLAGYLFMPVLLTVVLLIVVWWVSSTDLGFTAQRRLSMDSALTRGWRHIQLTIVSTAGVLAIAVPVGILLTRPFARRITPSAIAVFNIGQGVPSIGLIALFALWWAIGFWPAVVALIAYSALPVLRNTMVGLEQVDPSVIESARGMGMTRLAVLARIELPLAIPVMMAGVRTALVINVGTATLATFIGAGGLGEIINAGIVSGNELITVVGSVLTAVLALLIDYLAGIAEDHLRPRGL